MKNWLKRSLLAVPLLAVMGFSNHKVSTHNAETLDASLQTILQPLSQADRRLFMENFFRMAKYAHCLDHGVSAWSETISGSQGCAKFVHARVSENAQSYLSDRRMDDDHAYVRTDIFGSTHHGHSRQESLVVFIDTYGKYLNGLTANQIMMGGNDILQRGSSQQKEQMSSEAEIALAKTDARLEQMRANYAKIERVSANVAMDQSFCRKAIKYYEHWQAAYQADLEGRPRPQTKRPSSPSNKHCMVVADRRSRLVKLSDLP